MGIIEIVSSMPNPLELEYSQLNTRFDPEQRYLLGTDESAGNTLL